MTGEEKEDILRSLEWFINAVKNGQIISFEQILSRDENHITIKAHML